MYKRRYGPFRLGDLGLLDYEATTINQTGLLGGLNCTFDPKFKGFFFFFSLFFPFFFLINLIVN